MKFVLYYFLLLVFFLNNQSLTFAKEATSSATPSASLLLKLKALKDDIASKASILKLEINKRVENRAIVGTLEIHSDNLLAMMTKSGRRNIILNDFTLFWAKNKTADDLSVGDNIIALGDMDDNNNLVAKKIIKPTIKQAIQNQAIFGKIDQIFTNSLVVKTKSGLRITILVTSKSILQKGNEDVALSNLKKGDLILVLATQNKSGGLQARLLYIPIVNQTQVEK